MDEEHILNVADERRAESREQRHCAVDVALAPAFEPSVGTHALWWLRRGARRVPTKHGRTAMLNWVSDSNFTIDDTAYVLTTPARVRSAADRFFIVKPTSMIKLYAALIDDLAPQKIMELGIYAGGSTAFLAQAAHPRKLVAIDITDERVEALDEFVAAHDLSDVVSLYFGVDQSDSQRLATIVEQEFDGELLDLVIDDASHLVAQTRASFNTLFPRLRPGGVYVIEDWGWAHNGWGLRPEEEPLTVLLFELIMAMPLTRGLVDGVRIDPGLAQIRRGAAVVDPGTFQISDCYDERGRRLVHGL